MLYIQPELPERILWLIAVKHKHAAGTRLEWS